MSQLNVSIKAFSTNFCLIKSYLSGNTVWLQASDFQKIAKMDHFEHFLLTFVHSKCKQLECWMRFFLWFFKHCVLPTIFFSFHCYFPKWDFSHDWWSDLVLKPLFSFLSASSHLSPLKKCDEGWVWNAHSQELFKHFWSAQADIIQHGQCSKKRVLSTENQCSCSLLE